jgi:hypothetical protein
MELVTIKDLKEGDIIQVDGPGDTDITIMTVDRVIDGGIWTYEHDFVFRPDNPDQILLIGDKDNKPTLKLWDATGVVVKSEPCEISDFNDYQLLDYAARLNMGAIAQEIEKENEQAP